MELKATIKNRFGEEGDTEFDPADVNGSDSDYPEESVEEVNEQYIKGWGRGGMGERCNVVVMVVWGEDKHKVLLKNKHVTIIVLCFWYFCVILFQVKWCNYKNRETGKKCVRVKLKGLKETKWKDFLWHWTQVDQSL